MTLFPTSKLFTEPSATSEVGQILVSSDMKTLTRFDSSWPGLLYGPAIHFFFSLPRRGCPAQRPGMTWISCTSPLRDELGDKVGAQPLDAALAAVAAFLDAAERRLGRGDGNRVDANHA